MIKSKNTIIKEKTTEIKKFNRLAQVWWTPEGPMAGLHLLHEARMRFIRRALVSHFGRDDSSRLPLSGLKLLDVGCGAGLVSESLARLGADVTGIDPGVDIIRVAREHADEAGLDICYKIGTVADALKEGACFDAVLALELLEHLDDARSFIEAATRVVAPDGLLFFSTLNRTLHSFLFGIVTAEYIARWLEPGTHDWHRFIKPSELSSWLWGFNWRVLDIRGLVYKPFEGRFELSREQLRINYIVSAKANPSFGKK